MKRLTVSDRATAAAAGALWPRSLRKVPNTDLSKMAAIGYCFGGLAVLEMARDGQNDLAGVVSFHGVLAAPIDPVVPDDQTMAFWKEMRDAKQRAPHLHQLAYARGCSSGL
jgi:dienelactone hydrolase